MISIVQAFGQVLAAFDALEVPYAVGGSVASSLYGNYRMTNDVDILVDMRPGQVREFVERLGPDFVADIE